MYLCRLVYTSDVCLFIMIELQVILVSQTRNLRFQSAFSLLRHAKRRHIYLHVTSSLTAMVQRESCQAKQASKHS
jgi:hypothetical protein